LEEQKLELKEDIEEMKFDCLEKSVMRIIYQGL
jgi:signal recognition particle GTPase